MSSGIYTIYVVARDPEWFMKSMAKAMKGFGAADVMRLYAEQQLSCLGNVQIIVNGYVEDRDVRLKNILARLQSLGNRIVGFEVRRDEETVSI